eukprot:TRINITY_DN8539_c0_g1_i1.p1 TRINITY_DN8539_c0_g1~~TRINITY_DN8539_c0_g1_i1.p1  ORF type:complete len:842 (+),score=156.25 TRINITY_DN8539_c0_g1_i1:55-2580(+)
MLRVLTSLGSKTVDAAHMLDMPVPVEPWCGKCKSCRIEAVLPLKPEELKFKALQREKVMGDAALDGVDLKEKNELQSSHSMKKWDILKRKAEFMLSNKKSLREVALAKVTNKKRLENSREPRILTFSKRMLETANHPAAFSELTVNSIQELVVPPKMQTSKFARTPFKGSVLGPGGDRPDLIGQALEEGTHQGVLSLADFHPKEPEAKTLPCFAGLTVAEVSRLERFVTNHVKQVWINACAAANCVNPREGKRQKATQQFGSVPALFRKLVDGTISEQEDYYLMSRLRTLPFLDKVPEHLFRKVVESLQPENFSPGQELFYQHEEADCIYILLEGEVELRSEIGADALDSGADNSVKEAPLALLVEDVIQVDQAKSRPFLPRAEEHRIRSRTVQASARSDSSGIVVSLIVPMESIILVSMHFRGIEAQDRADLVNVFFAKCCRIQPAICKKFAHVFDVETFSKSHVLVQEGTKPDLNDAKLYLIIEGEVQLLFPGARKKVGGLLRRGKVRKETAGRGKFLGDAVLYGEWHGHSVVCTKETQVLTLLARHHLHFLLGKQTFLERPPGYVPNAYHKDDSSDREDAVKGRKELVQKVMAETKKSLRLTNDLKELQSKEWKMLCPRYKLPKAQENASSPAQSTQLRAQFAQAAKEFKAVHLSSSSDYQDVCTAPSAEMFLAKDMAISGPMGAGFSMLSLEMEISKKTSATKTLEAEHRAHTSHGYHLQDSDGRNSSQVSTAPGSVILLDIASKPISPSPPPSRENRFRRRSSNVDAAMLPESSPIEATQANQQQHETRYLIEQCLTYRRNVSPEPALPALAPTRETSFLTGVAPTRETSFLTGVG